MPIQATMNFRLVDKAEKKYTYKEWIDFAAKYGFVVFEMHHDQMGSKELLEKILRG